MVNTAGGNMSVSKYTYELITTSDTSIKMWISNFIETRTTLKKKTFT